MTWIQALLAMLLVANFVVFVLHSYMVIERGPSIGYIFGILVAASGMTASVIGLIREVSP